MLLTAANDPDRASADDVWFLLDPAARRRLRSVGRLERAMEAVPDESVEEYSAWRLRRVSRGGPAVRRSCPNLDRSHVWRVDVRFPRARGDGAGRLYFVSRREGLRYWFAE